jgi:Spy/CpxP family protein refolding chaperone
MVGFTAKRIIAAGSFALTLLLICCQIQAHAQATSQNTRNANLSSSASAGVQEAQDSDGSNAQSAAKKRDELLQQLNLSPEQKEQLRQIAEKDKGDLAAAQLRLRRARRAYFQALFDANPNEAEIERLSREVADAQSNVERKRAARDLEVRRVLTPEQLEIFRSLRRQARQQQQMRISNGNQGLGTNGGKNLKPTNRRDRLTQQPIMPAQRNAMPRHDDAQGSFPRGGRRSVNAPRGSGKRP